MYKNSNKILKYNKPPFKIRIKIKIIIQFKPKEETTMEATWVPVQMGIQIIIDQFKIQVDRGWKKVQMETVGHPCRVKRVDNNLKKKYKIAITR